MPDPANQLEPRASEEEPAAYLARQLGPKTLQDINLLLLEGLFFYRKDNDFLFAKLSERQTAFRRFWDRYFDLDLVVEENVAYRRLRSEGEELEAGFRNPNIPLSGRTVLHWGGPGKRERSIVFMLFLQFYEAELRRREDAGYGERLFFHHEFYQFVQDHYTRWFANREREKPSDHTLFQAVGEVFDALERFRFIERAQAEEITAQDRALLPRGYEGERVLMYRAMDGLRGYNPHALTAPIALGAYSMTAAEDAPEPQVNGGDADGER